MAVTAKLPYQDINDTLRKLKIQVVDSLAYARENIPLCKDPETLFYYLKQRVHFKNDPRGVELLQTMQTLFKNGGRGDCDCFVITCLAACIVQGNGWQDLIVTIAGRSKVAPVHIWSGINWKGQYYAMDLTERKFDSERNYPLRQDLTFKI
jgi:hypothetical protein